MNTYYELTLEVPGELGPRTIMDTSVNPPLVSHFHLVLRGWDGDHLVENFPCFLVTKELAESFVTARLTGFELADLELERDDQLDEFEPGLVVPEFIWFKVSGVIDKDDFFVTSDYNIALSERALELVKRTSPKIMSYRRMDVGDRG